MRRKLYPSSTGDRTLFWSAVLNAFFVAIGLALNLSIVVVLINGFLSVGAFMIMYFLQDQSPASPEDEYSVVISKITDIGKTLSGLSEFLERERKRVSDTEGVLKKLEEEKTKLEPIVASQRETVEAILSAHTRRTASYVWKERVVGFFLGTLASMLASVVYSYFK